MKRFRIMVINSQNLHRLIWMSTTVHIDLMIIKIIATGDKRRMRINKTEMQSILIKWHTSFFGKYFQNPRDLLNASRKTMSFKIKWTPTYIKTCRQNSAVGPCKKMVRKGEIYSFFFLAQLRSEKIQLPVFQ